jgi:hypothetical protein
LNVGADDENHVNLKANNAEVHRLRKYNATLRDDYARAMKRLAETQLELEQTKRDKAQMEQLKQKDYEYIIKQDRQLEQYKEAYSKVTNKYQGK